MVDFSNVEVARENEELAASMDPSRGDHRNWIVTIRFYSFLHYTEQRLTAEKYDSDNHKERMDNIQRCPALEDYLYNIYRSLYDLSRDSRYECERMNEEEVTKSEERLERGKELLGFNQTSGSSHKYST